MKRLEIQDLFSAAEWLKFNNYSYFDVVAELFTATNDLDLSILIACEVFNR